MSRFINRLQFDSEKVFLGMYLIGMVVFGSTLAPLLGNAWQEANGVSWLLIRALLLTGVTLQIIAAFGLSFFAGLLFLMVVDTKKRLQGVLLILGSAVALSILSGMGLLLPNIYFVDSAPWLLFGFAAGIFIGGGRNLSSVTSEGILEFRRASTLVFYILSIIMLIAFAEYHFNYSLPISISQSTGVAVELVDFTPYIEIQSNFQNFLLNSVFVVGFVITTRRFVQYDAKHNFFVLGPKASGKSLLLVGSYLEALERFSGDDRDIPLDPSQDLMSLIGELDNQQEGWFVDATRRQELEDLNFRYIHGSVFPKNVELSSVDYAGELLEDLPDALMETGSGELPATVQRAKNGIENADTLVLLIDSNRFVENERLDVDAYFDILRAISGKNVILVATKADILAEDFREKRGLEAEQYYDEFKQYVNSRLGENQTIKSLQKQANGADIHPVYYQTRINDNGERVPMRNSGSVVTVGFDHLLNILGGK